MTISSFLFEICRSQIQRISSAESLWKGRRQTNPEFFKMSLVLDISETKIFFPPLNNWFLFISKSEKLEVAKISGRKENFREAKKKPAYKLRLKRAKFAVSAFWTQCDTLNERDICSSHTFIELRIVPHRVRCSKKMREHCHNRHSELPSALSGSTENCRTFSAIERMNGSRSRNHRYSSPSLF